MFCVVLVCILSKCKIVYLCPILFFCLHILTNVALWVDMKYLSSFHTKQNTDVYNISKYFLKWKSERFSSKYLRKSSWISFQKDPKMQLQHIVDYKILRLMKHLFIIYLGILFENENGMANDKKIFNIQYSKISNW